MKYCLLSIVLILIPSIVYSSPIDGIYSIDIFTEAATPDVSISQSVVPGRVYLAVQELEDNALVLTMLNSVTNDWQAYTGQPMGSGYQFLPAYSQTNYGNAISSQEIFIRVTENDSLLFSQTLIIDPVRLISGDGLVPVIVEEKLTKIIAGN